MAEWVAFKEGIKCHVLACNGELWEAIARTALTAPTLHHLTLMITSISDLGHREDSLHYVGRGFDVRFKGTRKGAINTAIERQEAEANLWAGQLGRLLGKDWDVVVEVDHIHVEYDPK